MLGPCLSSVIFIHGCYPWMASTDGIHRWKRHPWMTSTDDSSIHGWHFSIHGWHVSTHSDIQGWHFHLWMRFLHPWIESSSIRLLVRIVCIIFSNWKGILIWKIWCIQFLPKIWLMKIPSMDEEASSIDESAILGCHPWIERCHVWMSSMDREISSMDGEMSPMDKSVIHGCHPWMTFTDGDNRWRTWTQQKCLHLNMSWMSSLSLRIAFHVTISYPHVLRIFVILNFLSQILHLNASWMSCLCTSMVFEWFLAFIYFTF